MMLIWALVGETSTTNNYVTFSASGEEEAESSDDPPASVTGSHRHRVFGYDHSVCDSSVARRYDRSLVRCRDCPHATSWTGD